MPKSLRGSLPAAALLAVTAGELIAPAAVHAYVGPGAGFAFVSSLFILLVTMMLAVVTLVTWPVRLAIQKIRGSRALAASRVKRVIVLGLDGQDPELTEALMDEGVLPNFAKLRDAGSFNRLGTTLLAESPVAWTSFQTGCNPGKHRIFDFLVPNRKSHLPELCSARVEPPRRSLPLGPFRIPLGKPLIEQGRKSQPFWKTLGDHGIVSTILRVPITFPAEKFNGTLLSAMSVPDLNGSQGTYYYYSSDPDERLSMTSGVRVPVTWTGGRAQSVITGPENSLLEAGGEMLLKFEVQAAEDGAATLLLGDETHPLPRRQHTPWITLSFKPGLGMSVTGIVRFYLLETDPHLKLYMTPINIDPDQPALPISHPFTYAVYLSKTQGRYATLGLAEDTSALNEEVVDEDAFLEQTYLVHEERERMFFDALDKTSQGAVVCVFDITDRLQHMFFRHLDETHPANRGRNGKHKDAIRKLYIEMDRLVGKTMKAAGDDTALFVMSDHGFKPFRRGVNLNTWLYQRGFLALKGDIPTGADMFGDVDWSRTQAYAVGFGGIYLNLAGREAQGTVTAEEVPALKQAIREGLLELVDHVEQVQPVREVYDATEVYSGPYVPEAPDLIVGFRPGHRVGWTSVTGGVGTEVIEDNTRYWSGDHNFNPPDVPGMLFSNRRINSDTPSIMDIGPTVLDLFGVKVPGYCDGQSLMPAAADSPPRDAMSGGAARAAAL
ncbi:MAG: nucleotide pyrophosphatase [Acidobacteria bacterium]|nr:nucleotide pyrophosphatase [Acidobacteriota bacterium]